MSDHVVVTTCGWCPTPLPYGDAFAVSVHFLTQHGIRDGSHSLRYFYPENDELEQMWNDAVT